MEDGTETLKAFARLILPLSINGIVEGFAHAVMTEKEIKREGNTWLVACRSSTAFWDICFSGIHESGQQG